MASVPNSSARGRPLFELLEEQQEPFLLDAYLLENGYSNRILRSEAAVMCWPGNACRKLQKLSSHGFKRRKGGIFRCILTKLVYGKFLRKALNWDSKTPENARLSVFGCFSEMVKKTHVAEYDCLSCSGGDVRELGRGLQWRLMEDSLQLSPVSVLELHSDEGFLVHNHFKEETPSTSSVNSSMEVSNIYEELLGSAYSPPPQYPKTKRELNQTKQLLLGWVRELEGRICHSHECLEPGRIGKGIYEQIFSWENQKGDVSGITHLIDSDFSNSRKEWSHFQPQMSEIGIEIEEAIFEEIREEAVLDMLDIYCTPKRC